jgi:predicted metal-dependent peptidase
LFEQSFDGMIAERIYDILERKADKTESQDKITGGDASGDSDATSDDLTNDDNESNENANDDTSCEESNESDESDEDTRDDDTSSGQGDENEVEVPERFDPEQIGEILPAGKDDAERVEISNDVDVKVMQAAAIAKSAGKLPASIAAEIEAKKVGQRSWRERLWDFADRNYPVETTWVPPNHRFVHEGVYLPSAVKRDFESFVEIIDVSGSIHMDELQEYLGESNAVRRTLEPERSAIVTHNAAVVEEHELGPFDDAPTNIKIGGGTCFAPVLTHVLEKYQPKVIVWYTDLCAWDWDKCPTPTCPVLFVQRAVNGHYEDFEPPFGEVVRI